MKKDSSFHHHGLTLVSFIAAVFLLYSIARVNTKELNLRYSENWFLGRPES